MSTPGELLINLCDRSVEQRRELHSARLQIEQLANALWNACEVIDDLRAGCAEVWPVDEIVGHARELVAKARKSETENAGCP